MTIENVKRLHKAYTECGNDIARLDLERWYPDLKVPKEKPKPSDKTNSKPPVKKKGAKDLKPLLGGKDGEK